MTAVRSFVTRLYESDKVDKRSFEKESFRPRIVVRRSPHRTRFKVSSGLGCAPRGVQPPPPLIPAPPPYDARVSPIYIRLAIRFHHSAEAGSTATTAVVVRSTSRPVVIRLPRMAVAPAADSTAPRFRMLASGRACAVGRRTRANLDAAPRGGIHNRRRSSRRTPSTLIAVDGMMIVKKVTSSVQRLPKPGTLGSGGRRAALDNGARSSDRRGGCRMSRRRPRYGHRTAPRWQVVLRRVSLCAIYMGLLESKYGSVEGSQNIRGTTDPMKSSPSASSTHWLWYGGMRWRLNHGERSTRYVNGAREDTLSE
jgi:hypothetical protein